MEEKRLDRVEDKLESITQSIANIDITLAKQAVQLEDHVRRSTNLEERMKPIEDHAIFIRGIMKLGVFLATIASLILTFLQLKH